MPRITNSKSARSSRMLGAPSTKLSATQHSKSIWVIAALISAICYVSLVANASIVEQLSAGQRFTIEEASASTWQYIREAILALLVGFLLLVRLKRTLSGRASKTLSFWFLTLFGYFVAQGIRSLLDPELGFEVALFGLRTVLIILFGVLLLYLTGEERALLLRRTVTLLLPYVVIQTGVAASQVLTAPPTLGATFLGTRPWGTFSSPNNLGLAMVGIALVAAVSNHRLRWPVILVAVVVTVSTGSRTSIMAAAAVATMLIIGGLRGRLALIPFGLVSVVPFFEAISNSAVSGREIGDNEARWDTWSRALEVLETPVNYLFGRGLGYGSNAIITTRGQSSGQDLVLTDSTAVALILTVGIMGFSFMATYAIILILRARYEHRFVLAAALAITALSFNIFDVSPLNLLVTLAVFAASAKDLTIEDITEANERWRNGIQPK